MDGPMLNPEECWQAVVRRDASRAADFYFGVLTTGVYCRPACPARTPLRQNVRFYATAAQAEADGLRPCRRCRPLEASQTERHATLVREICGYIESNVERTLTLQELAARARLSPAHLQRLFVSIVGVSPRRYAASLRMAKLKTELRSAPDVAQAVYGAGYGSSSRVYEAAPARLGMTPGQYRRGADGVGIGYTFVESRFGSMLLGATDRGICFLQFGDSHEALVGELRREYPRATLTPVPMPASPEIESWVASLNGYLTMQAPRLELPLDVRSTVFRMRVWNYLQTIPAGEVRTYGQVAVGIGQPGAARAVGHACASNPVALAIPCHRVIRGGGELGGYRWGLERKRMLLEAEKTAPTRT